MCVAAHPDDEDGSTLTVLRRKYGVHTVSLFSTFGEGGQNAVGPELYEDLGVIRARETMAASEVQGSEPYFLGFRDFGFSKSAEETFRAWGEKELLRRMVLQIRRLRPDVIITNHDTTSGHGHHQATGRMSFRRSSMRGDATKFPEQLTQAGVWQVKRLFVRNRGRRRRLQPAKRAPADFHDRSERDGSGARHDLRATSIVRFAKTCHARSVAQDSSGEWRAHHSLRTRETNHVRRAASGRRENVARRFAFCLNQLRRDSWRRRSKVNRSRSISIDVLNF